MKSFTLFCLLTLSSFTALSVDKTDTAVIVASAESTEFADIIEALGTLKANNSVTITSTVTELVSDIHFDDGQRVNKGDLLISMDTSDEEALLQEEQARLNEAQRQVKRLKPLAEQNTASKSALDTQVSLVSVSEAKIQGIQSQIAKRRIVAPFDGVIGLRNISVGTLAQPGFELATLDDDLTMKMDFSVPERHLSFLRKGLQIDAQTHAFPDKKFTGEIFSIDSRINPNTRAVQVRAIINNEDLLLKPGILMRIKLLTQPRTALLIPEEAVISSNNQHAVFVVNDQKQAIYTTVKLGTRYAGKIEILNGLQVGTEVIIHGTLKVSNGTVVNVIANKQGQETLAELLGHSKQANQIEG